MVGAFFCYQPFVSGRKIQADLDWVHAMLEADLDGSATEYPGDEGTQASGIASLRLTGNGSQGTRMQGLNAKNRQRNNKP